MFWFRALATATTLGIGGTLCAVGLSACKRSGEARAGTETVSDQNKTDLYSNGCERFKRVVQDFIPQPEKHLSILMKYAKSYATRPTTPSAAYDQDLSSIKADLIALPGGTIYFKSSDPEQTHENIMAGYAFLNALSTVVPEKECHESDYLPQNRDNNENTIACNIKHYWTSGLSVMMRGYYLSNNNFRIVTPINVTQFPEITGCEGVKFSNKVFPDLQSRL